MPQSDPGGRTGGDQDCCGASINFLGSVGRQGERQGERGGSMLAANHHLSISNL